MSATRGTWTRFALVAAAGASAAFALAVAPARGRGTVDGTLTLRAALRITGGLGTCAEGTAPTVECIPRRGQGSASGLGTISESYVYLIDGDTRTTCPAGATYFRVMRYPVQLVVAGKGSIDVLVEASPDCLVDASPNLAFLQATQAWTVTGGSGRYAGASGSGTVGRAVSQGAGFTHAGTETWQGTLVVPGLEFDVTAPVLSGATNRIIRIARGAKTTRVRFAVSARDDADGRVPATCTPRSGSRFGLGRTRVACSASDSSGNTATASFTVVVRHRR
jgi:HYR domain